MAVALSQLGELLGEIAVAASAAGYRELVSWLAGLDGEVMVGIEGAGSYGAGVIDFAFGTHPPNDMGCLGRQTVEARLKPQAWRNHRAPD